MEGSREDSAHMKLSLSISNQILQLNDSELWKNIFDEIEDESGKDRDVEIDASSSMAVFDERFGLGRNRCLKSRKPRSGINTIRDLKLARIGLRIATDCSHGLGCDKILSTYLGENVKGMERVMPHPIEFPFFRVRDVKPHVQLVVTF
ncbi:uncharacterized protein [Physcomitrium patens]|uniref:uncharacterized protein n=1 Tax=Physcomitrium patens TaxID=3218 RepID=UPI003CCCDCA3